MNMGPKIGAMCGEGKETKRFEVTGSGCKISDSGTCFQSPNFPNRYGPTIIHLQSETT
mgnify:CR=1 FL=1